MVVPDRLPAGAVFDWTEDHVHVVIACGECSYTTHAEVLNRHALDAIRLHYYERHPQLMVDTPVAPPSIVERVRWALRVRWIRWQAIGRIRLGEWVAGQRFDDR